MSERGKIFLVFETEICLKLFFVSLYIIRFERLKLQKFAKIKKELTILFRVFSLLFGSVFEFVDFFENIFFYLNR